MQKERSRIGLKTLTVLSLIVIHCPANAEDLGRTDWQPWQATQSQEGVIQASTRRRALHAAQSRQQTRKSQVLFELSTMIRTEKDEKKREGLAKELTSHMEELFDEDLDRRNAELASLETRLSKLRKSVEKRQAARDRIIKNRIESLMLEADGLGLPGDNESQWNHRRSGRNDGIFGFNGSRPHQASEFARDFTNVVRTRMVPHTKIETQTRQRMVNGKKEIYQVQVPTQEMRQEEYQVAVPMQTGNDPRSRPPGFAYSSAGDAKHSSGVSESSAEEFVFSDDEQDTFESDDSEDHFNFDSGVEQAE